MKKENAKNAKKQNEDSTKFKKSEVEELFNLVKDHENKVRICLGMTCVSLKKFNTFEDADKYIKTKPYELLINSMFAVIQFNKEHENENNSTNN